MTRIVSTSGKEWRGNFGHLFNGQTMVRIHARDEVVNLFCLVDDTVLLSATTSVLVDLFYLCKTVRHESLATKCAMILAERLKDRSVDEIGKILDGVAP